MSSQSVPNIHLEISSKASASVEFYRPIPPNYSQQEPVESCLLVISKLGYLIEYVNGNLVRSKEVPYKTPKKIIVHHEFQPLTRYVAILCNNNKVSLLKYDDFELLHEWDNVKALESNDEEDTGKPTLKIKLENGKWKPIILDNLLLTDSGSEETEKSESLIALTNSLKRCIQSCQEVERECTTKEAFIRQSISELKLSQMGININRPSSEQTAATGDAGRSTTVSEQMGKPLPLKVIYVRHKIFQDNWIIGAYLQNALKGELIEKIDMTISPLGGVKSLQYRSKLIRLYKATKVTQTAASSSTTPTEMRYLVEELKNTAVRPGKKVFLFAVCALPPFVTESITCSGIISYQMRPMETPEASTSSSSIRNKRLVVPLQRITLYPPTSSSPGTCIDLQTLLLKPGFSFELLAMIASYERKDYSILSLISPLVGVSDLLKKGSFSKLTDLNNYFCFYSSAAHPLNYALLSFTHESSQKVHVTTYTRDDSQAILLARTLLTILPKECKLEAREEKDKNTPSKLLAKMNEGLSLVCEKANTEKDENPSKKGSATGKNPMPEVLEFEEKEYNEWRKKLCSVQMEMDKIALSLQNKD